MKYLLILLLSVNCFAQNAKVTAYRLVNENDDGPCSVKSYIRWSEGGPLSYVTAESNDEAFARDLLTLKKLSKKWKKEKHFCIPRSLGGDMTHNMFVIEYNGKNDTILADKYNAMIVFSGKAKRYIDKNLVLQSMFPDNIKEFFTHNFDRQIKSIVTREDDSITSDKIRYQGELATDFFSENFENAPGNFQQIKKDSLYGETERIYAYNNDTIRYYKEINITVTNRDSGWDIGEFKIGDTENALIAKYPASTKIQKFFNIRYEDIKRNYFYWVALTEDKGNITYIIKDHIIDKIEISLKP